MTDIPSANVLGWLEKIWFYFFPPKPKLSFERKNFVHWYEEDNNQSSINADMFIINRGKKTTTIRKVGIIKMVPDHLGDKGFWPKTKAVELPVGIDVPYSKTFFFRGDHLRYDEIEVDLEFIHTEGVEVVHAISKLMDKLKKIRDEDERKGAREVIKRPPKPCLEIISFELENYELRHLNELIITIKNKSTEQIATGLRCIWFIQEEDGSEQIDSSTNRPNEMENISRASKQKPAITRSKLVCNPRLRLMLKKDRNYIVSGQVSCDQLQKAVQFNLPLIQLPKKSILDETLGKRTRS